MTAKEYLNQAYRLDQRINSKIEQIESLNSLATKCTSTISDMPRSSSKSNSSMESAIIKIISLQDEINADINKLVSLKAEIVGAIKNVGNLEHQTLLESRYLCYKTWEQIAVEMNYTVRNIQLIHKQALKNVVAP